MLPILRMLLDHIRHGYVFFTDMVHHLDVLRRVRESLFNMQWDYGSG